MLNKNAKFDINCPKCRYSFSITVGQVQSGETVSCPNCQMHFDTNDLKKSLQEVEDKLNKLGKKISKTINIKFKF